MSLFTTFWYYVSEKIRPYVDVDMNGKKISGLPTTGFPTADGDGATKKYVDDSVPSLPVGLICMWSGTIANIPAGWALCDGGDSRPDLRSKFIRGAASGQDPGGTGGSDSITLSIANLPSHTHGSGSLAAVSGGGHHHHWGYTTQAARGGSTHWGVRERVTENAHDTTTNGAHPHTISGSTGSVGSGTAFDNRPAYYALAFIIKT